jgi:hypothetical protein
MGMVVALEVGYQVKYLVLKAHNQQFDKNIVLRFLSY